MKNLILVICMFFLFSWTTTGENTHSREFPSLVRLKEDLTKSVKTILDENPNAKHTDHNMINMGMGGLLGGGQFYGYTWQLNNGLVDQVNFIMEFDQQSYNQWIAETKKVFGTGKDLNGNGFVWLVPEMGGLTLLIVNGDNKLIIASAGLGYANIQ